MTAPRPTLVDAKVLQSLAHPVRLDVLWYLMADGPATASVCARAVGDTPSNCSYHLRVLAANGLVQAEESTDGRERPWRATISGFDTDDADPSAPQAAGTAALLATSVQLDQRSTRDYLAGRAQVAQTWRDADTFATYALRVSPDELRELVRRLDQLIRPFIATTRDHEPADAETVHLGVQAFPPTASVMRTPAPLQHPGFRWVWVAGLVSDTGDWLLFIALPVVVYQLTGSALGTSLAFLVELAPGIVLAPLAGRLADRWNGRRVLFVLSVTQAAVLLPLLAVRTRSDLPILYVVILGEATLMALFDPVKNAMLPTLLPRADVVGGNALVGLNQNLGRLVGGPLGGVVLATGGLRFTVIADVASYLLAAALISRLSANGRSPGHTGESRRAIAGSRRFTAALQDRRIRVSLLVAFTAQVAQGIFIVLFVLFAAQRLHRGSAEIGWLRGVQAVGAIGASLVLAALARRIRPAPLTALSAWALGLLSLMIWNAPTLSTATALYVALFILVGAPGIVMSTAIISTVQLASSDEQRGRAFAALGLAGNAGQAIGMLAAGLLTATLGLTTLLDTQGVLYLLAGAVAGRWLTADVTRRGGSPPARPPLVHATPRCDASQT